MKFCEVGGTQLINAGMMSSNTDLWETPQEFFNKLDAEFGFDLDVCALPENAKCRRFYTPDDDGLLMDWDGVCWMNPPYGREIGLWVRKAYVCGGSGCCTVVCLLPSRTDTKWFQDYCLKSTDIRFVRGRLKFGGAKNSAPFPSVVVVFSRETIKRNM